MKPYIHVAMILTAATVLAIVVKGWAPTTRSGIALWSGLTRTEMQVRVSGFLAGVPVHREDMRLVVDVVDAVHAAQAESAKRVLGVDLGTTRVSVTVPVRIHYSVDLAPPGAVEFQVDEGRRRFIAVFPDPEVQAVEVFREERRTVVEPGWARLKAFSGRAAEEAIDAGLGAAVRREAAAPAVLAPVREHARAVLGRFVAAYLRRGGVWDAPGGFRDIQVRFRGERDAEETAWLTPPGRLRATD